MEILIISTPNDFYKLSNFLVPEYLKEHPSYQIQQQIYGFFCSMQAMRKVVGFYKENTSIIMETFASLGFSVYGGKNAPYVWVHFPGRSSWDVFSEILEKTHVVTTPGSGFGPAGDGFIRVSAFGHRGNVLEACKRFKQLYK